MEQAESESDGYYVLIVGESEEKCTVRSRSQARKKQKEAVEDEKVPKEVQKLLRDEDGVDVKFEPLEEWEYEEVKIEPPDEPNYKWRDLVMEYVRAMEDRATAPPPPLPLIMPFKIVEDHFTCLYCRHISSNEKLAIKHFQFEHGKKYHKCLACNTGFRRLDAMLYHESNCRTENAHLVKIAREVFCGRARPRVSRNERRATKIPCGVCAKMICYGNMKSHLEVHSEMKKYSCPHCPARFRTKRAKQAHVNAHSGVRPYRCDQCPKAYTSDTALRAHKLDHGESLFLCEYCDRAYKRKHTLKQHLATHADGNEYLCNECGKVLHNKTALEHHTRAHRRDLPRFTCLDCGKSYTKMTALNYHMKGKHGRQIITRKMFFNTLPLMVDVSDLMVEMEVMNGKQADDSDAVDDADAVDATHAAGDGATSDVEMIDSNDEEAAENK